MEYRKLKKLNFEVKPLFENHHRAKQNSINCSKREKLSRGCTNLMYACQQGFTSSVVNELRSKPNTIYRRDRSNKSALHYCSGQKDLVAAASVAVAAPELLESADEDGFTPLHLAVIQGNISLVNLLLANNANVNVLDNEGHSVVHWATVCGEIEALRAVLLAGANVSSPDINGGSPLHYAAQMCGANYEGKSNQASTKLALEILETLLAHPNSSVDVVDSDGRQPLLWAASAGSAKAILALIKAGARIESADRDGLTALHCAASRGHTESLDVLINLCGAPADLIDLNGCTALHYAVTLGHADASSLLLDLGADPNRQDRKGRTPAHCACAKGQFETVKILASKNANLWLRNAKGDLPVHEAASSGRKELVLWFLEQKPNQINVPSNDGRTLLHIAASNENIDMCKMLLELGADINSISRTGTTSNTIQTPLDCALQKGHRSIAKYLQAIGGLPANKIRLSARRQISKTDPVKPLKFREKEEVVDVKTNSKRYVVYVERSNSQQSLCNVKKCVNEELKRGRCKCRHRLRRRASSCCDEIHYGHNDDSESELCRSKSNLEIRRRHKSKHKCTTSSPSYSASSTSVSSLSSGGEDENDRMEYSRGNKRQIYKPHKFKVHKKRSKSNDKHHYCDDKICNFGRGKCEHKGKRRHRLKKYHSDSSNDNFDEVKINVNKIEAYKEYLKKLDDQKNMLLLMADANATKIEATIAGAGITKNNETTKVVGFVDEIKKDVENQVLSSSRPSSATGPGNKKARPQSARASSAKRRLEIQKHDNILEAQKETTERQNSQTDLSDAKDGADFVPTQVVTEAQVHAVSPVQSESSTVALISSPPIIRKESLPSEGTFILEKPPNESKTDESVSIEKPASQLEPTPTSDAKEPIDETLEEQFEAIISDQPFQVVPEETSDDVAVKPETTDEIESGSDPNKEQAIPDQAMNLIAPILTETQSFTLMDSESEIKDPEEILDVLNASVPDEKASFTILNESFHLEDLPVHEESEVIEKTEESEEPVTDLEQIETDYTRTSFTVIDGEGSSAQELKKDEDSDDNDEADTVRANEKAIQYVEPLTRVASSDRNGRRKKFKRKVKSKSTSDGTNDGGDDGDMSLEQEREIQQQCSKDQDSGFEPSPRAIKTKSFSAKIPKRLAFATLDDTEVLPAEPPRKPGDQNSVNMATVSISMQKNIKRYYMERKIFQHLLELKSLQIRSSKSNESVLVKRAVEDYHKSILALGLETGSTLKRYPYQEYSFKNFEIFLYETLKNLQKNGTHNFQNISEVYKEAERRLSPEYGSRYERALNCTTKTHRCLHAAHAYTGIPCAAYIPMMNHHTIPKLGFGSYKTTGGGGGGSGSGSFYLPKILTRNPRTSNKVSLELSHGNNKQLIPLPYDKLDKNKKYYVTFSVKGNGSLTTFEDKTEECEKQMGN